MYAKKKQDNSKNEFVKPKRPKFKKKSKTESEVSTNTEIKTTLSSVKRKRSIAYNPNEEARLERLVFGNPSDVIQNLKNDIESEAELECKEKRIKKHEDFDDDISNGECNDDTDEKDSVVLMKSDEESIITIDSKTSIRAPVWIDEDDEQLVQEALVVQNRKLPKGRPENTYKQLLQNKFRHITQGTPKWAKLDREKETDSDDSDNEILKYSNHLVPKKTKSLSKGNIDLKVLTHINKQTRAEGPFVNTVQFHESSTIAVVAGSSGVVSLFEVDGRENNKLHSLQFERFPIRTARFLKEGTEVIVGSMSHAHCYSYDLMSGKTHRIPLPHDITNMKKFKISPDGKIIAICGRLGEIHFLSSTTKELIGTMKMDRKCRDLAFTPDSTKLITYGESSEIYSWDVSSRTCINRAYDDGCLSGCSIAISPNSQYIATGSKQGAVNIYEAKSVFNTRAPTPVKTVLNLVTAVTNLKFNPTSEILAFASDRKANAFKMLHLPSFNVFSNFPSFNTKMFNVLDIDFSPGGGYMGIGNNRGFAYLYRLKHYGNY